MLVNYTQYYNIPVLNTPNLIIFEVMLYLAYSLDKALERPSKPVLEEEQAPAPMAEFVEET